MPQELLRKYIRYARQTIHPRLTDFDTDRISQLYVDLREQSARTGGIPITVRHIESMVRMAEAHAKMHLRQLVNHSDVNMAIRVMLQSFIETQKFVVMNQLNKRFKKYITFKRDNNELIFYLLKGLVAENVQSQAFANDGDMSSHMLDDLADGESSAALSGHKIDVQVSDLLDRAREYEIDNLEEFFSSELFLNAGFQINSMSGTISFQEQRS